MNVAEAKRWLSYALSDLDAARTLLQNQNHYPRHVCFLAQQSAEKTLKAILVYHDIEFPFTHDLDRLRDLIPDDWQVKSKFPDLAELSFWAIEARYPSDMPEVSEMDARQALKTAEAIYETVYNSFSNEI